MLASRYTDGMTAKKPTKTPAKRTASKTAATKATPKTKPVAKKAAVKQSSKVDIYPNRMALAVATLAAVSLAVFGLIALS